MEIVYLCGTGKRGVQLKVENSYSTGEVKGDNFVGGLVGLNDGTVSGSFWDTQTSGQTASDGGTGKSTDEMKTQSTFTDAGWDFTTIWDIGGETNDGYPFLNLRAAPDPDPDPDPEPEHPAPPAGFSARLEDGFLPSVYLWWLESEEAVKYRL